MKGKISLMWRVAIALVLVLSFSLVAAVPVAASPDITGLEVTVTPTVVSAEAYHKVIFQVHNGLQEFTDTISVEFPAEATVPESLETGYTPGQVKISTAADKANLETSPDNGPTDPDNLTVTDQAVMMWLPAWSIPAENWVMVEFGGMPNGGNCTESAGILNPADPDTYALCAWTCEEDTKVCQDYEVTEWGPGPVDLYLKHVAECGYIEDVYVDSHDTIQEALDAADDIWTATPPYDVYESWDLYIEMPEPCNLVGAKIVVHPDTYEETIVIDTPGVEVVSVGGSDVTIIDAAGLDPAQAPAAVYISAGGVTFDGFTVMNAGVGVPVGANGWPDVDDDDIADIKGILVDMDSEKNSVLILNALGGPIDEMDGDADMARVNILNNEVYGSTAHGIAAWWACVLVSGNDVHNNQFDGFFGLDLFNGVETKDPLAFTPNPGQPYACTEINYNTFADNGEGRDEYDVEYPSTDNGIQIIYAYYSDWCDWWKGSEPQAATIYIVGNEIYRNSNAGIYLGDGINDMVVIKFNQIEYNDVFGISSHMRYPLYDIVCIYNDIVGNLVWGIKNWEGVDEDYPPDDDDMLIATHNYWGDLSGPSCGPAPVAHEPSQQSDALGSGDTVSHWVEYKWWLTSSFKVVQTGLIRHYGSDLSGPGPPGNFAIPQRPIVLLKQGWNTMSTPVALDERADQLSEILALGGWMQKLEIAFTYDPVNGWRNIEEGVYDPQLLPLMAILVKMKGPETYVDLQGGAYADRLPILLRITNWLPARNLEPGWNLVGPNMGFWSQDWRMDVDEVLSSIAGSWGVAISPDMPGQRSGGWVCTPPDADDYEMFVGDGYWVFITKSTTLAGFRMAPWYLQDWEMDILNCELPPWWDGNK